LLPSPSSPTAAAATAAPAALPVLALRLSTLAVLHFGIEALRGRATRRVFLIEALIALLCVGLRVGMLLLTALRLQASAEVQHSVEVLGRPETLPHQ